MVVIMHYADYYAYYYALCLLLCITVLLVNTQCDQVADGQTCHAADMEAYCKDKGYVAWFETSAKDNINIDEATRCLISRVSCGLLLELSRCGEDRN